MSNSVLRHIFLTITGFVTLAMVAALLYLIGTFAGPLFGNDEPGPHRILLGLAFVLFSLIVIGGFWAAGWGVSTLYTNFLDRKREKERPDLSTWLVEHDSEAMLLAILSNDSNLPPLLGIHPTLDIIVKKLLAKMVD